MKDFYRSPIVWLWVPIAFILMQIGIEIWVPPELKPGVHSEWGPHETMQTIFIGLAFIVGLITLLRINWKTQTLMGAWIALATLCCFYVSGEEISWGQHIANWHTPDTWGALNDQNETNLHNTSAWLDQKPRALLFVGIVIGGLIIPALRRWAPHKLPQKFAAFFPPDLCIPSAIGVLVPYLVQEITHGLTGHGVFERVSELQELYMYYFVLLYLLNLKRGISQV